MTAELDRDPDCERAQAARFRHRGLTVRHG
jgi:hypothetical protein